MNRKHLAIISAAMILLIGNITYASETYVRPETDDIIADSYIVIDRITGETILEKNSSMPVHPASLTKILTAVIGIENISEDEYVTTSQYAGSLSRYESTIGLLPDEKMKFKDLLSGMMIGSGNDAAIAIAEHISGTYENFSNVMNSKSNEIGLNSSNWMNPSGITQEGHYTTSRDLAILTRYAYGYELFKQIVSTEYYSLPVTNKHIYTDWNVLENTNKLMRLQGEYYRSEDIYDVIGVKTGTTTAAGSNLISAAHLKNGLQVICVLNGVRDDNSTNIWVYTLALLEKAGKMDNVRNILEENELLLEDREGYNVFAEKSFSIFDPNAKYEDIQIDIIENKVNVNLGGKLAHSDEVVLEEVNKVSISEVSAVSDPQENDTENNKWILLILIGTASIIYAVVVYKIFSRRRRRPRKL